jgi:hypothetical protein
MEPRDSHRLSIIDIFTHADVTSPHYSYAAPVPGKIA